MTNITTRQLFVLFLFKHGVISVVSLRCQTPQFIILGKQGILNCSFPSQFTTIAWYDSTNDTAVPITKIEPQENGESEVSGDGYESGAYNISSNGFLIIPSVTLHHNRTFKVLLIDKGSMVNSTNIVVITIVPPSQSSPAISLCETGDHCFVNVSRNKMLNCTFTGANPAVTLTWYVQRNNQKDTLDASTTSFSDGNNTSTSISTLDLSEHAEDPLTIFTCEASGPALRFQDVSTSVFVYDINDRITSRDASVAERNVVLNSSLKINCANMRSPTAFVWSFQKHENSKVLLTSTDSEIKIIDNLNDTFTASEDGTLHVMHVDYSLEGIFTCTFLEAGQSSLSSIQVKIIDEAAAGGDSKFPIAVIVVLVLILLIVVLCCVIYYVRKNMQSSKDNADYDEHERNPLDVTSSSPEKASEQLPEDEEKPCIVEMETYDKGISPEAEEEPEEETSLQLASSEQAHLTDEVKDSEEMNVDPKEETCSLSPDDEEACPADVDEVPENFNEDAPEEETGTSQSRTAVGAALSNWRLRVDHEDIPVDSVTDLEKGDHIVFSGWALHPRCHGIVVDTNTDRNEIRLVRFTYRRGVVEEWMAWKPPIYKVLKYYMEDKVLRSNIYDPDAVIRRARSMINNDRLKYSIAANNCKTFARWCKTDATPAGYGYD